MTNVQEYQQYANKNLNFLKSFKLLARCSILCAYCWYSVYARWEQQYKETRLLLQVQNPLSEIPKSESSQNESFDYSIITVYK